MEADTNEKECQRVLYTEKIKHAVMKIKQNTLFDMDSLEAWREEWVGMPSYNNDDITPMHQIIISFKSEKDFYDFVKFMKQKIKRNITYKTKSFWFPDVDDAKTKFMRYTDEQVETLFNEEDNEDV